MEVGNGHLGPAIESGDDSHRPSACAPDAPWPWVAIEKQTYRVARAVLRNHHLAEEVVQDVCTELWRSYDTTTSTQSATLQWAEMLARRRAIDLIRRTEARGRTERRSASRLAYATDPAEVAINSQAAEHLRRALAALPPNQYEVIERAYYRDMTQRAIAADLDEALGTIKTRMRHAVTSLRTQLDPAV